MTFPNGMSFRMNPTTATEGVLFDQEIEVVAESISSDWLTIKDFCKEIDPPFKRKDAFLAAMERKRGREKDVDDRSWAKRCLQTWIKENPDQNFLRAVYNASNKLRNNELSSKLRELPGLKSKTNA